jgi:membrane protein YdbS with pleckstrin-like domain
MPTWVWIIQFQLLVPIVVILVGQVALLLTSALYQTPQDGASSLFIYIAFAALATLLLAPAGPFIHRFTYHIPTFLLLVCIGTLIYDLIAFPFSRDHRLKLYFIQQVDLDAGSNTVSLTGLDEYVQKAISQIPSAQGQQLNCTTPEVASRANLVKCGWAGIPAHVAPKVAAPYSNKTYLETWLDYDVSGNNHSNEATIRVVGRNTRACRILFDTPITDLVVDGAVSDPRFNATGDNGSSEVRLWHREWSRPWNVSLTWDREKTPSLSGKVVCLWSDANAGAIPAFDEVQHYLPKWAVATKYSDGLVEGFKRFTIYGEH